MLTVARNVIIGGVASLCIIFNFDRFIKGFLRLVQLKLKINY